MALRRFALCGGVLTGDRERPDVKDDERGPHFTVLGVMAFAVAWLIWRQAR